MNPLLLCCFLWLEGKGRRKVNAFCSPAFKKKKRIWNCLSLAWSLSKQSPIYDRGPKLPLGFVQALDRMSTAGMRMQNPRMPTLIFQKIVIQIKGERKFSDQCSGFLIKIKLHFTKTDWTIPYLRNSALPMLLFSSSYCESCLIKVLRQTSN